MESKNYKKLKNVRKLKTFNLQIFIGFEELEWQLGHLQIDVQLRKTRITAKLWYNNVILKIKTCSAAESRIFAHCSCISVVPGAKLTLDR